MPYRADVDRNLCVSTASCIAVATSTFELDAEGVSTVKKQNGDTDGLILEAAKSCPVNAISVYDDQGKKIWPQE